MLVICSYNEPQTINSANELLRDRPNFFFWLGEYLPEGKNKGKRDRERYEKDKVTK